MSKFVINNFNSNSPTLQGDSMTTYHAFGVSVTEVKNGMLTNGKVMLPVSGTVKRYKDGRIEVNGEFIDWDAIVRSQQQTGASPYDIIQVFGSCWKKNNDHQETVQKQSSGDLKVPDAMINEPDVGPDEKPCIICAERSIKTTIVDCGHQIYCISCARSTVKQGTTCPICRIPITKIIRIFEV